jgi:hypothetical protein
MDPLSYAHPLTTQHIDIVRNVIGFRVIGPQHGQISTSEGKGRHLPFKQNPSSGLIWLFD